MSDIINKIIEVNKVWSDPEYCLQAVKHDDRLIKYVRRPTPEMAFIAIEHDLDNCDFIMLPESEHELKKFINDLKTLLLSQSSNYTSDMVDGIINRILDKYNAYSDLEYSLNVVKQFGHALMFITKQTPEICAAAIKQNPEIYEYVRLPEDENEKEKFIRELGLLLLA